MYSIILDIIYIAIILILGTRILIMKNEIRGIENCNKMQRDRIDELTKYDGV